MQLVKFPSPKHLHLSTDVPPLLLSLQRSIWRVWNLGQLLPSVKSVLIQPLLCPDRHWWKRRRCLPDSELCTNWRLLSGICRLLQIATEKAACCTIAKCWARDLCEKHPITVFHEGDRAFQSFTSICSLQSLTRLQCWNDEVSGESDSIFHIGMRLSNTEITWVIAVCKMQMDY